MRVFTRDDNDKTLSEMGYMDINGLLEISLMKGKLSEFREFMESDVCTYVWSKFDVPAIGTFCV